MRGFAKFQEQKTWRYVSPLLLSHPSLLLFLLVVWNLPCRVLLVHISLIQSLYLSLLRKIKLFQKKKSLKGVVDSLKYVDIPVRDEEKNQCALSNQMTKSFTHRKSNVSSHKEDSNLLLGSQGDTEVSPSGDLLIDGLSPRKMAKVREVLCSLDIKVYSRRKNSGSTGN